MHKSDYEIISASLAFNKPHSKEKMELWKEIVCSIANGFHYRKKNFDLGKFLAACHCELEV